MSETNDQKFSPGEITRLIPLIMADMDPITKSRKNQQQGYSFRGIDDIYNEVQPLLVKHGVFIVPFLVEKVREERETKNGSVLFYTLATIDHRFYATDGSFITARTIGEAMDSGDKSSNKAQSAAMKYACIEVFSIPTMGDNDSENHSPEPAARTQAAPPPQMPARTQGVQPDQSLSTIHTFIKRWSDTLSAREQPFTAEQANALLRHALDKKGYKTIEDGDLTWRTQMIAVAAGGAFDDPKWKNLGQMPERMGEVGKPEARPKGNAAGATDTVSAADAPTVGDTQPDCGGVHRVVNGVCENCGEKFTDEAPKVPLDVADEVKDPSEFMAHFAVAGMDAPNNWSEDQVNAALKKALANVQRKKAAETTIPWRVGILTALRSGHLDPKTGRKNIPAGSAVAG